MNTLSGSRPISVHEKKARRIFLPGLKTRYAVELVDHAKHDRANKGKGEICSQYAQPVDESHGNAPLVYVTAHINAKSSSRFRLQKVSAAAPPAGSIATGVVKDP